MRKTVRRRVLIDRVARQTIESLESRQLLAAHIVGSATNYATIQAAINAAPAGAIVTVDAGTYTELVTINKTLTLKGAKAGVDARTRSTTGETIVTGISGSYGVSRAFQINASNVILDGFTVQGETAKDTSNGAGIVMAAGVSGTRIVNNIVKNNVAGVFLANNSDTNPAIFQYNLFKDNNNAGPNGGRAIYTDGGISGGMLTNVIVDSNTFSNNRGSSGTTGLEAAVAFETKAAGKQFNIRITNNSFSANGKSLLFFNTTNVVIEGNTATGILDWYSGCFRFEGNNNNVSIRYNNISNNSGPGVAIDDNGVPGSSSGFVINYNNITNNGTKYSKRLGVVYEQAAYVGNLDARNNWWGNTSGPSGDGKGTGDGIYGNAYKTVSWNVTAGSARSIFSPWSTSANPTTVPSVITPGAPSGLAASAASVSQINLTWALGTGSPSNMKIERSLDNVTFTQIALLAGNATSYSDTALAAATTYFYRVRATNSAGDSGYSNVAVATTAVSSAPATSLSDLAWTSATSGWNTVQKNKAISGNPLTLNGVTYATGLGTHAVSNITYNLAGGYESFSSDIGIDAAAKGQGAVQFVVLGDGVVLYDSGVMTNGQVKKITISVEGVQTLTLRALPGVPDSIDYAHADWANATLYGISKAPVAPTGLTASAASSSQIKLSWNAGSANVASYSIDRSTDGTTFTTAATNVPGTSTIWTDPATLSASTKYYYRIRALNTAGASPDSGIASATTLAQTTVTYLSDMNWTSVTIGWGAVQKDKALSGNTITMNGVTYAKGLGTHAVSEITYALGGQYASFLSDIGVDDAAKGIGTVRFQVVGDGVVLYDSGVFAKGIGAVSINVNVAGVQTLSLRALDGGDDIDFDHADWAGARLLGAPTSGLVAAPTNPTVTTPTDPATSLVKSDMSVI